MKKRLIAIALAASMLIPAASAAPYTQQEKTADAMNYLGLFLGDGYSYNLNDLVKRHDGTTMLVRMLGKETEAKAGGDFGMPFNDVPAWAKGYIGYAWKNKIVNGLGDGTGVHFGPEMAMTDYMFLTLTLRALGYSDSGENAQFVWNDPYELAREVGLISTTAADNSFTRGDAIAIFWNAMGAKLNGTGAVLSEKLIEQGVFTAAEFAQAEQIQKSGRAESQGVPMAPEVPDVSGSAGSSGDEVTPPAEGDKPSSGDGESSESGTTDNQMTYEKYNALSGEEQQAFFNSFDTPADFFEWYNAAKAEYEESQNRIEIGENGSIDLGDLIGENS